MVRPFADWVAPLPLSQHNSPPPSKSHAPIHELILFMSWQCTNPGPPYPCPVCLRPLKKSQYSFKCYGCLSWVHQRCSGLASYTLHHNIWRCSKCLTYSPSPPKRKPPSPIFPSPTSIPPLMDSPLFPPRSPHLTGKGDIPPPFSLSLPAWGYHCFNSLLLHLNLLLLGD